MENVLKKDAVLGFSVLRLAHACSTGQGQPIPSFHNALMCLGEPKLTRWTHLLQGNCGNSNSGPSAVVTAAVVRGRMMELLAQPVLTQEECETAYLVGIFSLLEELLGLSKDEAMALLPLPAAASEALRYGTGLYGPMLALTKACESEDDAAYSAAAAHLNFSSHHINMSHMQALVWADTVAA